MTFSKLTEAPSYYNDLEKKDTATILKEINQEDQKVAYAVQRALPSINDLINQIIPLSDKAEESFMSEPEPVVESAFLTLQKSLQLSELIRICLSE